MSFDAATLYALLPAYLRVLDQGQGGPLQDYISVLAGQIAVLEEDLAQNYDNLFIETCAPWVVPYIGDLIQTTPLTDAARVADTGTVAGLCADLAGPSLQPQIGLRARADVAKTIYYRRRKTTLPMLEQLAADVTGWAAHVREFFTTLSWSQAVRNHIRPDSFFAPDLRDVATIDRIDGPFDTSPRVVDVRPPSQFEGWHNIRNVGLFLWRLESTELDQVTARPSTVAPGYGFHVSPLGQPAPLFARWRRSVDATIPTAEPLLPGPIRPAAFYDDLVQYEAGGTAAGFAQFYGHFGTAPAGVLPEATGASLFIVVDGTPVPPEQIETMNLSTWRQPSSNFVGVDVALGRISLGPTWTQPATVQVSAFHGFPADLGGSGYSRQAWLLRRDIPGLTVFTVDQSAPIGGKNPYPTIGDALADAAAATQALVSIEDSASYAETLAIDLPADASLTIEAADGQRPHLRLGATLGITGAADATLTLSGLLVEGALTIGTNPDGTALGRLRLLHTTLVPGTALDETGAPVSSTPSIAAASTQPLDLELIFSIAGPLSLAAAEGSRLWLLDSIVDGLAGAAVCGPGGAADPGPVVWIERSTLLGTSCFQQMLTATEALFTGVISVLHRQQGCVRFSFVPDTSSTPRRYRCQPDYAIAQATDAATNDGTVTLSAAQLLALRNRVVAAMQPSFTTTRYGLPAYAQLHLNCPTEIAQGAEDGSDMGAYCHLKQPQRLKNLQLRLQEYLPFGRQAGTIFVT